MLLKRKVGLLILRVPAYLFDEAVKLFDLVVANRLNIHLQMADFDTSDGQYGFQMSRATADAILRIREQSQQAVAQSGVDWQSVLTLSMPLTLPAWP